MILELVVLLRIQHLEERGRRIAAEVLTELVDLVEQEERVGSSGLLDVRDDLARERTDVGTAVRKKIRSAP
jgi:hypothetical protein